MIVDPAVIVAIVAISVMFVFGCGVVCGRRLERYYWRKSFLQRLHNMGLTVNSGYRTLEEQRRLRTSPHYVSNHYTGPRYGVDPTTRGESRVQR